MTIIQYYVAMNIESHRIPPFPLRLEPEIRTKLEKIARANGRSLNSELSLRIQSTLEQVEADNSNLGNLIRSIIREELDKTTS